LIVASRIFRVFAVCFIRKGSNGENFCLQRAAFGMKVSRQAKFVISDTTAQENNMRFPTDENYVKRSLRNAIRLLRKTLRKGLNLLPQRHTKEVYDEREALLISIFVRFCGKNTFEKVPLLS